MLKFAYSWTPSPYSTRMLDECSRTCYKSLHETTWEVLLMARTITTYMKIHFRNHLVYHHSAACDGWVVHRSWALPRISSASPPCFPNEKQQTCKRSTLFRKRMMLTWASSLFDTTDFHNSKESSSLFTSGAYTIISTLRRDEQITCWPLSIPDRKQR